MRTDFKDALNNKDFETWREVLHYVRLVREDLITEAINVADCFNMADTLLDKETLAEHFNFTCKELDD